MKKKMIIVISLFSLVILSYILIINLYSEKDKNDKFKIVTSFYPVYIIASNLMDNIDNVEVVNMTQYVSGCIHDYVLKPNDMRVLEDADVLIINGGGIENFLDKIIEKYPGLKIIDSSKNIDILESNHSHEGEEATLNPHIWLDPSKYIVQVNNISDELSKINSINKAEYLRNKENYIKKIDEISEMIDNELSVVNKKDIIIFHDSLEYFADIINLNVRHVVDMDEGTVLSASEIKHLIEEIKEYNVEVLFTELQFDNSLVDTIKKEVAVDVYSLDTIVTGDETNDAYINAMKENIRILKEALK